MKIGIVGQGASGVLLAIMLKKESLDYDITIFDHNDKCNKKLLATGNGRCNLGNTIINKDSYNNEFAHNLVKDFNLEKQREFFDSIGIMTRNIDNLVYPFSLSSNQLVSYLNKYCKKLKIKLVNNASLDEYNVNDDNISLIVKNKTYKFDKVIFATGGSSTPNLGSDGSLISLYKKHGYSFTNLKPGLTPVVVKENVKGVENERVKCNVKLFINKSISYEENGEVLFKKNGISGIAIFNCASIISRHKPSSKIKIVLDLFPNEDENNLIKKFEKYEGLADFSFLEGIFSVRVAEFIRKNSGAKNLLKFDPRDIKNIAKYVKNMEFTYEKNYDFASSQVTVGGLELTNVNENLLSKKEKNIYFAGEVLDIDGLCGGYNLMLAFATSYRIFKDIIK